MIDSYNNTSFPKSEDTAGPAEDWQQWPEADDLDHIFAQYEEIEQEQLVDWRDEEAREREEFLIDQFLENWR